MNCARRCAKRASEIYITSPPSTTKTCPVMYDACSDARKAHTPAMSPGVPSRPIGICAPSSVRASAVIAAVMSVSMKPGATAFARMFRDASFMEDLGADSLDTVELVMEFEKEFNIDIPDEDAEKLRTVGDALTYLKSKSA